MAFTSLNHYLDAEWLKYAYRVHAQRRCGGGRWSDGAGVCGQSGAEPAESDRSTQIGPLSGAAGSASLHRRSRMAASGRSAFPSFEDKVAQRAIVMLLEPIYEQDFLGLLVWLSAGSQCAPSAAGRATAGSWNSGGRWVLDVDVRKYFDSIASRQATRVSCQTSHRWRSQKVDRQVAQSGRAGRRGSCPIPKPVRRKAG